MSNSNEQTDLQANASGGDGVVAPGAYLDDPAVAAVLSKLASLQGHAVPAHRFGMLERTQSGVAVDQLSRARRATELWASRFPAALVREMDVAALGRGDFPLLWISDDSAQVLLVRGQLSHGGFSAEDERGTASEVRPEMLSSGHLLSLKVEEHAAGKAAGSQDASPKSAGEWFAFAISKHRRVFLEGVFATFMISVIGLTASLYTMQVYDRVIPTQGFSTLWVLTFGVLLAVALEC